MVFLGYSSSESSDRNIIWVIFTKVLVLFADFISSTSYDLDVGETE